MSPFRRVWAAPAAIADGGAAKPTKSPAAKIKAALALIVM